MTTIRSSESLKADANTKGNASPANSIGYVRSLYLKNQERINNSNASDEYKSYLLEKAYKEYRKQLKKSIKDCRNSQEKPHYNETWLDYARRVGGFDESSPIPWKNYLEYTKSAKFNWWKKRVLKAADYKCQKCGEKAISAHHIRYREWGTEKTHDGIALCWSCHMKMHN
jgi:rRNA maturation protein Nop10